MSQPRVLDARFDRAIDKRSGAVDRLVVIIDRRLKSGKLDYIDVSPEQATHLAMRLLVAAERALGKEVRMW